MNGTLYLAWRYVLYHRAKTFILVVSLTMTMVLPLTSHLLIRAYEQRLRARAAETPLIVGTRGKRFDLVLKALYFTGAHIEPVHMSEVERLRDSAWGTPIPLELSFTVKRGGYPIVGTTVDYFDFRGLRPARGSLPLRIGQAVLGADVARTLDLGPGDHLFSDQAAMFDITQTYPLRMQIVGVLAETGTPDDHAVFTDIKTTWIMAGISHGHQDVERAEVDPSLILRQTDDEVVTNPGIVEYNEVTADNIQSFHTHAPPEALPLTAIIVLPESAKGATILKAEYQEPQRDEHMLVPTEVINDLMERVFRVQRLFDVSFAIVALATVLFLVLVVLLSLRLRRREMETMARIGCSRGTAFRLQAGELGLVLIASIALSGGIAMAVTAFVPALIEIL
jgi:putative ABC transport system permease protein